MCVCVRACLRACAYVCVRWCIFGSEVWGLLLMPAGRQGLRVHLQRCTRPRQGDGKPETSGTVSLGAFEVQEEQTTLIFETCGQGGSLCALVTGLRLEIA